MTGSSGKVCLDATGMTALLERLASEIATAYGDEPSLCFVGIKRRGDILAERLRVLLRARMGREVPLGTIDITLYRDDFESLSEELLVGATDIPFPLDRRTVVLVDDVFFTGRTIRAALDQLLELGRPDRIVLAVLIDRGWRELPIAPDFTGLALTTHRGDNVEVALREVDAEDAVRLLPAERASED